MTDETAPYGFATTAAEIDAWRVYDEDDPDPGYFEFDWLSARFPDLYHRFAISTSAAMEELCRLIDLGGLVVVDVGAGTGRSAIGVAAVAKEVLAVDAYESVFNFGQRAAREAGAGNVTYLLADRSHLPLDDRSVDVVLAVHAELDLLEAYRVLKADGLLVQLTTAPGALAGELTAELAAVGEIGFAAPPEVFDPDFRTEDTHLELTDWNGVPVKEGIGVHDFTIVADFGEVCEAAAVVGRFYGPTAASYLRERDQATVAWRYRMRYARVAKPKDSVARPASRR